MVRVGGFRQVGISRKSLSISIRRREETSFNLVVKVTRRRVL